MVFRVLSLFPGLRHLSTDPKRLGARKLYGAVVEQARQPQFFVDYQVPDTVEGRFDIIALHMFSILARLKAEADEPSKAFAQILFDTMFDDMDDNLREMGVGDTRVAKKVRGLAEDFYGRIASYDAAMAAHDGAALTMAISRNIYSTEDVPVPAAARLAQYAIRMRDGLAQQSAIALVSGDVVFPSILGEEMTGDAS